ncbi:hypothetical protein SAY87_004401 [Trapa incisa]|uniref:Uncharacterized protein n=1 Tax=Trapa incisa TaxID=236973 RepID=A0AAN7PM63_9MYRT|nr:hypothetical protein SAY87_004401 [Trapa incisa]
MESGGHAPDFRCPEQRHCFAEVGFGAHLGQEPVNIDRPSVLFRKWVVGSESDGLDEASWHGERVTRRKEQKTRSSLGPNHNAMALLLFCSVLFAAIFLKWECQIKFSRTS